VAGFEELPWLEGVVLRTISNFHNGPLSGLATYMGTTHWYHIRPFNSEDEGTPDEFILYELSGAEVEVEERRHKRFRELVGTHWDLDHEGRRTGRGVLKDQASWPTFYAEYPPGEQSSHEQNRQVGRFRARVG